MRDSRDKITDALFYLLVAIALLTMVFPFYWVVNTSLKAPGEVFERVTADRLPGFVPASFWLASVHVAANLNGVPRDKATASLSDFFSAQKEAHAIDNYSVVFDESGLGKIDFTYNRGATSVDAVVASIQQQGIRVDDVSTPTRWPIFKNYEQVFTLQPFATYLTNSAIVATLTTIYCLVIGSFCAYALARLNFPFRDAVLSVILAVAVFPAIAIVSPLFLEMKALHLLNTYSALVIPYTAFGLPLCIWTLTGFFKDLPLDLEEAARVDGCSRLETFFKIILPLAAPGVFTCAILVFIFSWNEFLFALLLMTKNSMRTVPVGITLYPGQYDTPWGTIFAAATIVTLPLVIIVFIFQRRIIAGLTAGAVKG